MRHIMIISMLSISTGCAIAPTTHSESPEKIAVVVSEQSVLDKCDTALNDCRALNVKKDDTIKAQQDAIALSAKHNADLQESQDSIVNSKSLWFAIGAIVMKLIIIL